MLRFDDEDVPRHIPAVVESSEDFIAFDFKDDDLPRKDEKEVDMISEQGAVSCSDGCEDLRIDDIDEIVI